MKKLVFALLLASLMVGCAATCPMLKNGQAGSGRYQVSIVDVRDPYHCTLVKCDSVTGDVFCIGMYGTNPQGKWKKVE